MLRFHTIVHPTDFSQGSSQAFRYASALARDCGARLVVVHAIEPAVAMIGEAALVPYELEELRAAARKSLDELQPIDANVRLEKVLRDDPAPAAILDVADESRADLIVMGTHGRTGLTRLLLGSVAELVLRRARCPVLTVKENSPVPAEQGGRLETAATE